MLNESPHLLMWQGWTLWPCPWEAKLYHGVTLLARLLVLARLCSDSLGYCEKMPPLQLGLVCFSLWVIYKEKMLKSSQESRDKGSVSTRLAWATRGRLCLEKKQSNPHTQTPSNSQ